MQSPRRDHPINLFQSAGDSPYKAPKVDGEAFVMAVKRTAQSTIKKEDLPANVSSIESEDMGFNDPGELGSPDMQEFLRDNENGHYDDCNEIHAKELKVAATAKVDAKLNIDDLICDEIDSPVRTEPEIEDPIMTREHMKCFSKDVSPVKNQEAKLSPLFANDNDTEEERLIKTETPEEWEISQVIRETGDKETFSIDRRNEHERYSASSPLDRFSINNSRDNENSPKKDSILPPLPIVGSFPITFSSIKTGPFSNEGSGEVENAGQNQYGNGNGNFSSYKMNSNAYPGNMMAKHFSPINSKGTSNQSDVKRQPYFSYIGSSNLEVSLLAAGNASARKQPLILRAGTSGGSSKRRRENGADGAIDNATSGFSTANQPGGLLNLLCNVSATFGSRLEVGCRCTRTNCLKLYCECFQSGKVCIATCACNACMNTKEESGMRGERTKAINSILSRRPDAFRKKKKTAAFGCSCKNSKCLKKYCVCFNEKKKCGSLCKCRQCENGGEGHTSRQMTAERASTIAASAMLYDSVDGSITL